MGERENRRARGRHARDESPSRAPVFSCAHYFQAPATRATLYSLFSSGDFSCYNQISTVPYLYCKQTNTSVWRGNKDLVSLLKALPTYLHNIPEKIEKDVICTVHWGPHTSKFCIFVLAVSYVKKQLRCWWPGCLFLYGSTSASRCTLVVFFR